MDADIPHQVAVFEDAYGMAAHQCAELAPLAVAIARRYHEGSRASAKLNPVWREPSEANKHTLSRAEVWVREMTPSIAARLTQPG